MIRSTFRGAGLRQARHVALLLLFVSVFGIAVTAQTPAEVLLRPQGTDNFPALYRQALNAFVEAQETYRKGQYDEASKTLSAFWKAHPPGTREWEQAEGLDFRAGQVMGVNYGAPACYSALRMLSEAVEWRLTKRAKAPTRIRLSVLLVGHSSGIQFSTKKDLHVGIGRFVTHDLKLAPWESVIEQSVWLFQEYVSAMTGGGLTLELDLVRLPNVDLPVVMREGDAGESGGQGFIDLANDAQPILWKSVPNSIKAVTDWWWVIYPSHYPSELSELADTPFITGGMGGGPGASPLFIIDDLWLLRKPAPYAGRTAYSEIERRAYLPQWMQHEFFHYLFRVYPQFQLERSDHQWFDRSTWPADFEGRIEQDYYAEALHKRLQHASPPLTFQLRYAPAIGR